MSKGGMNLIMSAHQPAYLPWLGYFDKIKRSDIFIFLDTVQYEKNSFTNRNKIKSANGPIWLSVPVIKTDHFNKIMSEMPLDKNYKWQKKHLIAIQMAYSRAPNFKRIYPQLQELYAKDYENIVDVTWDHLQFWLKILQINTKIVKSSHLNVTSKKSDFVFDLCTAVGADQYISGAMGINYLDTDRFTKSGIQIEFQEYRHPVYPQLYGEFIPNMGVVDFVMNAEDFSII